MSDTSNGAYVNRLRQDQLQFTTFDDLLNPWNFYSLFLQDDSVVFLWLRQQGLLAETIPCCNETCNGLCKLSPRKGKRGGFTFRCSRNKNHEYSMFKFSYFENGHTDPRDVMQFVKSYLDKCTLKLCSIHSGVNYSKTAVAWGSYLREVCVDWFVRSFQGRKLSGEIEIDESLFGRKWKHHRGTMKGKLISILFLKR